MLELKFTGKDLQDLVAQMNYFLGNSDRAEVKAEANPSPIQDQPKAESFENVQAVKAVSEKNEALSALPTTTDTYTVDELRQALAKLAQDKGPELVQQSLTARFGTYVISELNAEQLKTLSRLLRDVGVL